MSPHPATPRQRRRFWRQPRWAAGLLAALAWVQTAASAPSRAVSAFEEAEALLATGAVKQACPLYEESYALDPQLGVLLYLADCLERNGELASAYRRFQQALELAESRGDARVTIAAVRSARLLPRLQQLESETPGPAPHTPPELPGEGEGEGEGEPGTLELPALGPREPESPETAGLGAAEPEPAGVPRLSSTSSIERAPTPGRERFEPSLHSAATWALAGVGVAGLAGAGVLTLMAVERYDSADPLCQRSCTSEGNRRRYQARTLARGATLSGGIALSALAGATLLWWHRPRPHTESTGPLLPSVSVTSNRWQLDVQGHF